MSEVQTAKLKVDFVNPRVGDKPASIKADNKYWSVTDEDIAKIKAGETYHFAYKAKAGTGKWAGRTFLDITGIIATDSTDGRPNAVATPASKPAINGNGYATHGDEKRADIWLAVLVKQQTPVQPGDIAGLSRMVWAAQHVYQSIVVGGLKPSKEQAEELNDDIPF